MEAGLVKRILLNESGIFYKTNIINCAKLSATNCPTPNCPAPICSGTLLRPPINNDGHVKSKWGFLQVVFTRSPRSFWERHPTDTGQLGCV